MPNYTEYNYYGPEVDADVTRWAETFTSNATDSNYELSYLAQTFASTEGMNILEAILENSEGELAYDELDDFRMMAEGLFSHAEFLSHTEQQTDKVLDVRDLFGPVIYPSALEIVLKLADGEITAKGIEKDVAQELVERIETLIKLLDRVERAWIKHIEELKAEENEWSKGANQAQNFVSTSQNGEVEAFVYDSTQAISSQRIEIKGEKDQKSQVLIDLMKMKSWLKESYRSITGTAYQAISLNDLGTASAVR